MKPRTLISIISALLFFIPFSGFAQNLIKGVVIEKDSHFPIPFATVTYQKESVQLGVVTDMKGKFEIKSDAISTLNISCMGYQKQIVNLKTTTNLQNLVIELQKDTISLGEVIVKPGINPAVILIQKVLTNKDRNNFEKYPEYQYQCYFKTINDLKLAHDASSTDSAIVSKNKNLINQAVFLSEAVIKTTGINGKTEDRMIASKTSGLKDPIFNQSALMVFHHVLSFYNNEIPLLRAPITEDEQLENYVSPLSDGCLSAYRYELEDTIIDRQDSVFVVSFYPKKGKNFNSLKGRLFINNNGFALQSIIAEPSEKGLIEFRFHQEYTLQNGRWFPSVLNEEIGFTKMVLNKRVRVYPVYQITSVIDSVKYQVDETRQNLNFEKLYIDQKALKTSDETLNNIRPAVLNKREVRTYQYMDSLGNVKGLDDKIAFFKKMMTGRVPYKWLDFELNKIYSYNSYEKVRLGLGFTTNEKLSDVIKIGLYGGYGFADDALKYGANTEITLNKYHEVKLHFNYDDNLYESGYSDLGDEGLVTIRTYMGDRFDRVVRYGSGFEFRAARFLKVDVLAQSRTFYPTYIYQYKSNDFDKFQSDFFEISALMGFRQELLTIDDRRYVNKKGNPNIELIYHRGTNLLNSNSYNYNRYEAQIELKGYNGRLGQSNLCLKAGYIDRKLPYALLFTGEGSRTNSLPFITVRSFQTLLPYEFLSDRYIDVFYSHNFGSLLLETPKFKPQVVVYQNAGWGTLKNAIDHSLDFKTKEKIFLESGLMLKNLVRFNYINFFYIGFGGGAFFRYGPYKCVAEKDNLAFKMAVTLSFR